MSEDLTVNDLIIRAFAELGLYTGYKPPSGEDILTGLYVLNELLDFFTINGFYIPFYSEILFTLTTGKDEYVISKESSADVDHNPIVEINYVNIFADGVSYPISIISYDQVDKNIINPNIYSKPKLIVLQRNVNTSKVIFYQKPDRPYDCRIRAKCYLSNVLLQDHLTELPAYFHRFLRLTLARDLKDIYKSENWSETQEEKYKDILRAVKSAADFPLATDMNPVFGTRTVINDQRIGVIY